MANPNMKKGMPSVNPKGRPAGVFSTFSDTASRILNSYSRSEIIRLSDDEDELNTYPPFECLVIRQLANALRANMGDPDLTAEREKLYDRTIGKAQQSVSVNHSGAVAVVETSIPEIVSWLGSFDSTGANGAIEMDAEE